MRGFFVASFKEIECEHGRMTPLLLRLTEQLKIEGELIWRTHKLILDFHSGAVHC